ncbi:carboxylate--amine ligase [Actinomyces vulturis]|uniref:carboxylate--amine ligase n=1 Tax=Actinomyces vulturis TaxID=1857645 RepID=UPI00082C10AC|nr:carboxylate--amine ligase [Actinomyces vulturis]
MPITRPTPLRPVIIGGDIGVYGIGRSFHEAFGCLCTAVASAPVDAVARSSFFEVEPIVEHADDETLLATLMDLALRYDNSDLVLMANHDLHSSFIARNRKALSKYYALPFPDLETVDRVTDKATFAAICDELDIPTPGTVEVDMAEASNPDWQAPQIPFDFPVVAKAARGDEYDAIDFPGKRKIWFIESAEELAQLWTDLAGAGFTGVFLVQELIPGDNTQMRSITAYVDSSGSTTLMGSARVLLEDHAPTMIGNPVAMITEPFPQLWVQADRFFKATGYRGFANFDVKIDPRDGRALFFEVNPRIGRNNWYMTAAGANPMVPMVEDLVDHKRVTPREVSTQVLYTLVPDKLLLHYIRDENLRSRVKSIIAQGHRYNPLFYSAEKDLRRNVVVRAQTLNQFRKFKRYYPEPTDQSF